MCPFVTAYKHDSMYERRECKNDFFPPVCVYFLVLCTVGTSMLLCWPSAWNEKCLMPLVCLEGLSLFRRWTAMHYWLQNTPAMLFHLSSTADRESGFTFFFFSQVEFVLMCATVCVVLFSPTHPPLSPPFPIAPSGRLNGRYAETIPLSPHPTTQYADREMHETKDKGRQRQPNVEQWEGEVQPNGYCANSVTHNSICLTLFWALWCSSY